MSSTIKGAPSEIARCTSSSLRTMMSSGIRRLNSACEKASAYFQYTLTGTEGERDWRLLWERNEEAIKTAACFDGVSLLCTNAPEPELSAADAQRKYKEQIGVEQTIDFIKSPVQIRPTWLRLGFFERAISRAFVAPTP
jgi:hypothetical protein